MLPSSWGVGGSTQHAQGAASMHWGGMPSGGRGGRAAPLTCSHTTPAPPSAGGRNRALFCAAVSCFWYGGSELLPQGQVCE